MTSIHLLNVAAARAVKVFIEQVGSENISPREYEILAAVNRTDGLSQTAIMKATATDRSTAGEVVARLVRRGWLHRRRSSRDKRIYRIRLTDTGREILNVAEKATHAAEKVLLAPLSRNQQANLINLLELISAAGD